MLRDPWFWHSTSFSAKAVRACLSPAAWVYDRASRVKRAFVTTPPLAGCAVICVGNATLGGVGKTPFILMLNDLLRDKSIQPVFLSRGYGGALRGPVLVDPARHTVHEVGDEALMLAQHGPVWVAKDRLAGAKAAARSGARCILADDGFQNPSLPKDLSFLLFALPGPEVNAIFPAGPFRETLSSARARADIAVSISQASDRRDRPTLSIAADFEALLSPDSKGDRQAVFAFCGIGAPSRFFQALSHAGFDVREKVAFPDHHQFTDQEIRHLIERAKAQSLQLITTAKDLMRIPAEYHKEVQVLPVSLTVNDPASLVGRCIAVIEAKSTTSISS